ncbi:MAG: class I SAM-dependent methyltransferase [Lachnospiraceae bacterium]
MKQVTIYIAAAPAFRQEAENLVRHLNSFDENLICRMLSDNPQKDIGAREGTRESTRDDAKEAADSAMLLRCDEDGLTLISDGMELRGDFTKMLPRITKGRLASEQLVRAARIKNADPQKECLTAIDCTAGLGEDSILLAAAGFHVLMFEHNPVIAALLRDSLRRARKSRNPLLAEIAGRMELQEGDSAVILSGQCSEGTAISISSAQPGGGTGTCARPHIIFLDPMFPARQKGGISKKKLQILQKLELPCAGEEELLQAAMRLRPAKIVIKRPLKGPYLAGIRPGYSIEGKTIRYDVITSFP